MDIPPPYQQHNLSQQQYQDGSKPAYPQNYPQQNHASQHLPSFSDHTQSIGQHQNFVSPLKGIASDLMSSGLGHFEKQTQHQVSQANNLNKDAYDAFEDAQKRQNYTSQSQKTVATISQSPNLHGFLGGQRPYIDASGSRIQHWYGSASDMPAMGEPAIHQRYQNSQLMQPQALAPTFRSDASSQLGLANTSTDDHLQAAQWADYLQIHEIDKLTQQQSGGNIPRYKTQSQMKVLQQNQPKEITRSQNINDTKNQKKGKSPPFNRLNQKQKVPQSARVNIAKEYMSQPKSSSRSRRGDHSDKSNQRKSNSKKRDNSDLNVGYQIGLPKKANKSRNKKVPRSGSSKAKKRQIFNQNDFQSKTYQGDIRADNNELHNDSDVIEDSVDIQTQSLKDQNYNSPNFRMIQAREDMEKLKREQEMESFKNKSNIIIDVQNNTNQSMSKQAYEKNQIEEIYQRQQSFSDAHDEKNHAINQSMNTMSIQEQQFNGPQPNESLMNTISIQESSMVKSKNGDKNTIDKLSQIGSKQSLNSKVSATPGSSILARDLKILQSRNPGSSSKDGPIYDQKGEKLLSIAAANANLQSNLKGDQHSQLAEQIGSNAFHKLDSQTLREMLMKNNLSSRDQKEFQKEFEEFQEELKKRSSDSRTPDLFDNNQLSKSHNYMSDMGEAVGRLGKNFLGKHFTPGLSNFSDSQTIKASLGFTQNLKKKSDNSSIEQWNQADVNQSQSHLKQQSQSESHQIFTDAIRLGSAINQMLNMHKKKYITYK